MLAVLLAACGTSTFTTGGNDSGSTGGSVGSGGSGTGGSGTGGSGTGGSGTGGSGTGGSGTGGSGTGGSGTGGSGTGGGSVCPTLTAAAPVDPWLQQRLPSAGFGGTAVQTNGTHQDVFLLSPSPADYTRIGARLDWGGTLVFWGLSANPASNTLDANDTGRELQIALYDPARNRQACAFDASCLTSTVNCGNSITYLGWDPVQGGDECGRGPQASWSVAGDALRLVVTPVQWNPDWDAMDCRNTPCAGAARPASVQYAMDLRFITAEVVEVSLEVQSLETIDHALTMQEFPTLYVSHGAPGSPDLPVLLDSAGQAITIDQPANDGFTMKNFTSPSPWAAFQDTGHTYGVGLAMDQGLTSFQGWAGNGSTAPYFHNVRANIAFGLAAGATVRGRAYLGLGNFATIQGSLGAALAQRPPFGVLDLPAAGPVAQGASFTVAGWVLDTTAIASVRVELDGTLLTTLPVNVARPDVCALYPAYAGCPAAGYSGQVTPPFADGCAHLLRVVAVDPDGNRTVLGERLVQR